MTLDAKDLNTLWQNLVTNLQEVARKRYRDLGIDTTTFQHFLNRVVAKKKYGVAHIIPVEEASEQAIRDLSFSSIAEMEAVLHAAGEAEKQVLNATIQTISRQANHACLIVSARQGSEILKSDLPFIDALLAKAMECLAQGRQSGAEELWATRTPQAAAGPPPHR